MQRQSEPLTRLLGHEGLPERAGDHDVVALFAHGLDHLVGDVLGDVLVDHEFGAGGYGDDVLAELAAVERRRDHVALEAVLFAHGLDDALVHGQDVQIHAVHHVLHDEGFAGSDPQGHVKLAVLHHAGGVVGGRCVDLAAPRGDVLLADAVFLKDPLAEQIGVSGGVGHGDADGHLLFLDLGEGRNAGSLVHDEVHPG